MTARAPEEVAAPAPARQATFREVFAVREFRPLFGTFLLSTAGDELARVALTVLVYQRTNSPLLSALTFAIGHLPWLLGGPLLSALADRLPRHRVLISADAIRAVLLAGMAIPGTPLPVLLGLLFLVSLCAPPFESARSALMADVLEGDRYAVATSLTNITLQLAQVVGFLAAGAIVAVLNPSAALLIDAATFAVSAVWLASGLKRRPAPVAEDERGAALAVAGHRRRAAADRPVTAAAGDHRGALGGDAVRLRLRGRGRAAGRGARPRVDGVDRHPAGGQSARRDDRWAGHRPAGRPRTGGNGSSSRSSCCRWHRSSPPASSRSWPGRARSRSPPSSALLFVSGLGASWLIPLNVSFVQAVPSAYRGRAFGVAVSGLYGVQAIGALGAGLGAEGVSASAVLAVSGGLGLLAVAPALVAYRRTQGSVAAPAAGEGPSTA